MIENLKRTSTIIVTGLSGAGRATALNALEDCGYHRIDNLPAELIPHVIENNSSERPLALGMGSRRTDRDYVTLENIIRENGDQLDTTLVFLEASDETIMRRYNETRRVHPSAQGRDMLQSIAHEKKMLKDLREISDLVLDTTRFSPHELRAELKRMFNLEHAQDFVISVESFSYKYGTPPHADMIFDCRFLHNPHWQPELRELTGQSEAVQNYVKSDKNYPQFHEDLLKMLAYILPALQKEGRSYFGLSFGCTGGKHRSVTMAETLASDLKELGHEVVLTHREIAKMGQL